ncbi:MAG: cyclic-di-AMP receptor [bacterium]|jgi:uncharacterized protein YaaQ
MKLILAIIRNDDSVGAVNALRKNNFQVTKLTSTGGFLMIGNTTLLMGVPDERVDELKAILRRTCSQREHINSNPLSYSLGYGESKEGEMVTVGGATVFTLNVEQMDKL